MSARTRRMSIPARAGFRGLLLDPRQQGYPAEYLFTRLRGRRAKLIRNWKSLVYAAELPAALLSLRYKGFVQDRTVGALWHALLQEYHWVFCQMNERLRTVFSPYFVHAELRTLFVCLRSLAGENAQKNSDALEHSLLSDRMRTALNAENAGETFREIENVLSPVSPFFRGITGVFERENLRAAERELTNRIISTIFGSAIHPVIRQFFVRLVDSRNILTLYASVRVGGKDPLIFLPGGTVAVERLRELQTRGDLFAILPMVKQASGVAVLDPDPTQVEVALYRGVTKFALTEGRDPLSEGLILDYLWRCSLEVTNMGLLLAGKDLDRERVIAELTV